MNHKTVIHIYLLNVVYILYKYKYNNWNILINITEVIVLRHVSGHRTCRVRLISEHKLIQRKFHVCSG